MPQKTQLLTLTVMATAAITANTFISWSGTAPFAGDNPMGVACTDAQIGDAVACDVFGTTLVRAAGPIGINELIEVASGGRAAGLSSGIPVARALQAAAAADDLIEVLLLPSGAALPVT